ncbi:ATPase, T2SS/T4P/T4SS family [Ruegeria atlantica]|uniref:ATPase, T2SS/T4P/T4SS family n=1 Tax=Ruegeria atlantica TaxID=81569 RepID=UPI0014809949|nr:ATPase, T2SS/T4P/T4SS family [Ruegeria atlantica]
MTAARNMIPLPGPFAALLEAAEVIDICVNPDGAVFVERFGAGWVHWGTLAAADAEGFLRWCATRTGTSITEEHPRLKGRIPGTAHRVAGLIPPVVEGPTFSIRRHSERVISLEEYVPDPEPCGILARALAERYNILIAGATGSGKTTLLNACLDEVARIAPGTRLVTIEDTAEIRTRLANRVQMHASDSTGMDALLAETLRHAPTRIVLGEVREGHVLMTLLKAWHTGHPGGLVTLHANSAAEVMDRLRTLATEVMASDPTPALMQATDMIVFVRRGTAAPEIATILTRPGPEQGRSTQLETAYEI